MNLARGRMMASDYIECQAGDAKWRCFITFFCKSFSGNSNFLSIFGVAWGVIPEVFSYRYYLKW